MNQPRTPDGRFTYGRGGQSLGTLADPFAAGGVLVGSWAQARRLGRPAGSSGRRVVLEAADVYADPGPIQQVDVVKTGPSSWNTFLEASAAQVSSLQDARSAGLDTFSSTFQDVWPRSVVSNEHVLGDLPMALDMVRCKALDRLEDAAGWRASTPPTLRALGQVHPVQPTSTSPRARDAWSNARATCAMAAFADGVEPEHHIGFEERGGRVVALTRPFRSTAPWTTHELPDRLSEAIAPEVEGRYKDRALTHREIRSMATDAVRRLDRVRAEES